METALDAVAVDEQILWQASVSQPADEAARDDKTRQTRIRLSVESRCRCSSWKRCTKSTMLWPGWDMVRFRFDDLTVRFRFLRLRLYFFFRPSSRTGGAATFSQSSR